MEILMWRVYLSKSYNFQVEIAEVLKKMEALEGLKMG